MPQVSVSIRSQLHDFAILDQLHGVLGAVPSTVATSASNPRHADISYCLFWKVKKIEDTSYCQGLWRAAGGDSVHRWSSRKPHAIVNRSCELELCHE